ncbi:FtsX-like permease family protein [Salinirussus salinus]|uniref:FtsX-like permease family protein n=1 Tax=Salinirussus salinus TaxID=1198300 RepID=UPI00135CBEBA|nr:ABC transporter permease [Salinirussus salinus]
MPGNRLVALVGLGARRIVGRVRIAPQRVLLCVLGVGLAVGLMVAVTGISLGLASQTVIEGDDVDYWVVPKGADVQSLAVSTGGVQLGGVHGASERLAADPRVEYATPVLLELLPVRDATTGEQTYVLAVGVVARQEGTVLGLPTDPLAPGDPHYANGSYDGPWTGDVVLNEAAATLTNASTGARLDLVRGGANRSLTVSGVGSGETTTGVGTPPLALVHLSELQSLTGATEGDLADQVLVSTDDRGVRERVERVYPRTTVVTRSGLAAQQVTASNLPLAVAVAALVSAVVVGVLFVTTLMGLEVNADRRHLGTLAALGLGRRSRSLLVAAETVTVSLLGGVVGVVLGLLAILAMNFLGGATSGVGAVARFDPLLLGYALAVAAVIGLLGALYPILLSRRTDPLEVVAR